MYILKNAITSITRNKGRNILMVIIITIISSACAITLSIRNSATKLIDSYQDKFDVEATISMNRENMRENFKPSSENQDENIEKFNNIESITKDQILSYADSTYVKSYYYTYETSMNSSNIESASTETTNGEMAKGNGPFGKRNMNAGDFSVIGYSSYESMQEFIEGKYQINEGSISTDFSDNSCIINQELADYNNLSVGDSIVLVDPKNETLTYTLVIGGIYKETETDENNFNMFTNSVNTIITNSTVVENIATANSSLRSTINPTFILKSEDVIDEYEKELETKGLSEYYQLSTNLDEISSETKSISNLSTYALTFLILTLIIGAIVLFIINMINVRERKYEIGVLRTIGMKKGLVAFQFLLELLIVSTISLLIGAGIGASISVPTANKLLESEINSSKEEQNKISNNFGGMDFSNKSDKPGNMNINKMGVSSIDKITEINAIVDFKVLFELLLIGLILTVISSLSAVISISRFSPLTILKERT